MPHLETMLARLLHERMTNPGLFKDVTFPSGRRFIAQGEPDTTVYLLLSGTATVSKIDGHAQRHDIATLVSPTVMGELSALARGRTADVTAKSEVRAIAMDAVVLRDLCAKYPDFAQAFARLVRQRLAEQERIIEGSSRLEQIEVLAKMQVLALATPESHREILGSLIDLARKKPQLFSRVTYPANASEPFIHQGQALDRVSIVVAGEAEARLATGRSVRVGPGSPLGEVDTLSPTGIATANVFFTQDTEVLSVSREHFSALREPAEALAHKRLNEQFTDRLPPATKEILRRVRDQNTDALILRNALDLVHSGTGIFKDLNAGETGPEQHGGSEGHVGVVRQKCVLMASVASLFKLSKQRADVVATVQEIRGFGLSGISALKMFKGDAALAREDWVERVAAIFKPHLPDALSLLEFTTVRERLERLHWLDQMLLRDGAMERSLLPGGSLDDKIKTFLAGREGVAPARIFEEIDATFEELMEAGILRGSRRIADDLKAVRFLKVQAAQAGDATAEGQDLPREHATYRALRETRARLLRGEGSAIGGADYASQRFPEVLLERIIAGKMKVVVYDGTRESGLAYVVRRSLQASGRQGVPSRHMTTEVQGLDGSGGRTLITFHDEQVLLLTGFGRARQRHNADSILLFERDGRRIPEENLVLACEGVPYVERMREDIRRALRTEAALPSVLGQPLDHATLPTQLLILQNPREFELAFEGPGERGAEMHYASGALFDFYIGYAWHDEGAVTRYIVPKVGGKGLYGDTAGHFVEACFTAGIPNLGDDVVFNGTAGGFGETEGTEAFAGLRGLRAVKPGESLIAPLEHIAQYDGEANLSWMKMATVFGELVDGKPRDPEARRLYEHLGNAVSFTSNHVSVGAPGDETYELIRGLVAQGFASIDIEGGAIMKAVTELDAGRPGQPGITFTPVYTFSDNPLHSEQDRYDSLAIMGPFFEGARFHAELWNVLKDLLALVRRRRLSHASCGS